MNWDIDDHFRLENDTSYLRTNGTVVSAAGTGEANFESFEQELKLRYQSDWLNGVIGGFLTQIDENDVIDGGVFSFDTTNETTNYAAFGEVEVEVLPQVRLILGGRYDREEVSSDSQTVFFGNAASAATDTTFDAFLPKAGIVYNFNDDVSVGFTFQRGYRAGGTTLNGFTGLAVPFDPEFTNNDELSFRSQPIA